MKTIQISDEFWRRLRIEAAERGITMRKVIEELGAVKGLRVAKAPDGYAKELKVEYGD